MRVASSRDAELTSRKIEVLLMKGAWTEAVRVLDHDIKSIRRKTCYSDLEEFMSPNDVPLALSDIINRQTLDYLDAEGIETIGDLRRFDDRQLMELPHISHTRLDEIKRAKSELWGLWRRAANARYKAGKHKPRNPRQTGPAEPAGANN